MLFSIEAECLGKHSLILFFNIYTLEEHVHYTTQNTYSTLNNFSGETKNIWFVFHGLGYLSRYFIKYFDALDTSKNFIVAPQAPSKYYQGKNFKHVGASWLTKEETKMETANVLSYVDAVFRKEIEGRNARLILMGYSQGVSIVTRWMSIRKIKCDILLLHSGGIPEELKAENFAYLSQNTEILYHFGIEDPYLNNERIVKEEIKAKLLFSKNLKISNFKGKHEIDTAIIHTLSKK